MMNIIIPMAARKSLEISFVMTGNTLVMSLILKRIADTKLIKIISNIQVILIQSKIKWDHLNFLKIHSTSNFLLLKIPLIDDFNPKYSKMVDIMRTESLTSVILTLDDLDIMKKLVYEKVEAIFI